MYLPSCSNGSFYWLFRGHFCGHFLVSHVNLLTCSFVFSDCHTTNILTILKSSFISFLLPIVQSYIRHCHTFSHGLLHSFNSCHHCSTLLCSGLPIATVLLYLHFRIGDGRDSSCSCPLDLDFHQDVLILLLHTAFSLAMGFHSSPCLNCFFDFFNGVLLPYPIVASTQNPHSRSQRFFVSFIALLPYIFMQYFFHCIVALVLCIIQILHLCIIQIICVSTEYYSNSSVAWTSIIAFVAHIGSFWWLWRLCWRCRLRQWWLFWWLFHTLATAPTTVLQSPKVPQGHGNYWGWRNRYRDNLLL